MPPQGDNDKIDRLRRAIYSRKYADQLGERERRALEAGHTDVPEDWQHEEVKKEAPQTKLPLEEMAMQYVPAPSRTGGILKWILLAAALFFVAALAFFIYYLYFGGGAGLSQHNIDISVTGPSQIPGGELTDLEVGITNRNREALQLADLVVTYPPGTILNPQTCTTSGTCRISLGTIPAGGSSVIKLPAVYEGGAGQHATVHTELEYRLGNSSAIFVASSDYQFVFSSSPITLAVSGNTQTVSGQAMQLTLTLSSNADQPVQGVYIAASTPFGFHLTSSSISQDPTTGMWSLGTINPGDVKTITINGVLSGQTGDNRVFQFSAGTRTSATSTSIDAPLSETTLAVTVAQPFLNLSVSADNATSSGQISVAPGDTVNITINYTNNLQSEIDNAVVVARLSGISIDGSSIHTQNGFYRSTDSAVLWDKSTTGGVLAALPAGATGKLGFTFQMPSSDSLQGIQNPVLDISISAAGQRVGQTGVPENLQATADQKVAAASDLRLMAQGLYFTDPFVASGPMPPQASVETTYAILFNITNTTSAIQNAVLTAQLPPYVRLVGNHYLPASEKISFNSTTGAFTWNVGTIAPKTGLAGTAPRQVVIEVGVTPSTSQIGSSPALVQSIKLSGTDAASGAPVVKTVSDVTTNIVGDPGFSSVNAKVVAPPQ
ncbi:MAG TPA: hypothetical protein VN495_03920 [Candidatus Paceibacterota bacterium]|nr:hypothetical protein [Candidatus Paceibacterota bacterium]